MYQDANEEKPMTLNIEDAPSNEEISASKRDAKDRFRLWRQRLIYSGIGLLISVGANVPFSAGMPLHAWNTFGNALVLLTMALFLVFVYCAALWWGAWSLLRDLKKTYPYQS